MRMPRPTRNYAWRPSGAWLGWLALAVWLGCHVDGHAVVFIYEFTGIYRSVPDNDPSGLTDVRMPAPTGTAEAGMTITDVNVHLSLSGASAVNGDLYVYLQHGDSLAVLLNRVGRTMDNDSGYGDPGFDVTLDDQATNGDIHGYRETIFGNHNVPLGGPLTDSLYGPWAPDARRDDPSVVTLENTTHRDATLSQFNGSLLGGDWTLFLADTTVGGQVMLENWSLQITSIPEPGGWLPAALIALATLWAKVAINRPRAARPHLVQDQTSQTPVFCGEKLKRNSGIIR
jgi:subtilisin-like proprotein convertase family protein